MASIVLSMVASATIVIIVNLNVRMMSTVIVSVTLILFSLCCMRWRGLCYNDLGHARRQLRREGLACECGRIDTQIRQCRKTPCLPLGIQVNK